MIRRTLSIIAGVVLTIVSIGGQALAACPAPITLSLGDHSPSPGTQFLGEEGLTQVMMQLKIANFEEEVGISKIRIAGVGSGDEAEDIEEVRLYQDVNDDGALDGGDLLLGSGTFMLDEGEVELPASPNTALMTGGASPDVKNALVVYAVKGTALSGSTFVARLADDGDVTAQGGACGIGNFMGAPFNGGTLTVIHGSASASEGSMPSIVTSGYLFDGQHNVPMLGFRVAAGPNEDLIFHSVTIRDEGAASDPTHISAVRLWYDADGDGEVGAGDSQINDDQRFIEGLPELSIVLASSEQIPEGETRNYIVTYSFADPSQAAVRRPAEGFLSIARRIARAVIAAPFALAGCGQQGAVDFELTGAPEGFVFTDVNGNEITTADAGDIVQIRTAEGLPILQFTMGRTSVNLEDVELGRDERGTYIALSEGTISMILPGRDYVEGITGLPQELIAFLPCGAIDNGVMLCSGDGNVGGDLSGCQSPILLRPNSYATDDYTWTNTVKVDAADCTISADSSAFESFFGTGVLLNSFQPSIDDPSDLVLTGASSDRSIVPPSLSASGAQRTLISPGD